MLQGDFKMGLAKFKKELTNEQYLSLATKDEDTLYFITDTRKIYVWTAEYGGRDLTASDTASISLDNSSGLTGAFILSSEAGNSLTADNGLWAPPKGVSLIDNPVEGDFVAVNAQGQLKDSEYSLATAITEDSSNEVPTSAAVYAALEDLALLWDETAESVFPGSQEAPWKDYTHELIFPASVTDTGFSYLYSDGVWARLHLDVIYGETIMEGDPLAQVPLHMGSFKTLIIPAIFYKANLDDWEIKGGSSIFITGDTITGSGFVYTEENLRIISDLYYILKSSEFPKVL
jgi:hypothetical protein